MQFTRNTKLAVDGWTYGDESKTVMVDRTTTIDLVETEQKRAKTVDSVEAVLGSDGKTPLLDEQGKPLTKIVKKKVEKDSYPFLPIESQTINGLVKIFGQETVEKQLVAAFSRIFQQLWFKDSEKDESKFRSYLEAEDFGSVRERTVKTISAEIIELMKSPSKENFERAMVLQAELGEMISKNAANL